MTGPEPELTPDEEREFRDSQADYDSHLHDNDPDDHDEEEA
ncbi:hypothetical protein ACLQ2R_17665 [Streptosporangium sp. DT93]